MPITAAFCGNPKKSVKEIFWGKAQMCEAISKAALRKTVGVGWKEEEAEREGDKERFREREERREADIEGGGETELE